MYSPYQPPRINPYQQQSIVPASNFVPLPVTPPNYSFAPIAPTNYFNPAPPVQNSVPPTIPYNQASNSQSFYGVGNFYFCLVLFVCTPSDLSTLIIYRKKKKGMFVKKWKIARIFTSGLIFFGNNKGE